MTLAECLETLNLQPSASIEAIDLAFGKQRRELVRQNRKSEIAQLTAAYHQLRDHTLEQSAAATAISEVNIPEQQIAADLDRLLQAHKIRTTVKILEQERELQIHLHSRLGAIKSPVALQVMKHLQTLDLGVIETVMIYAMRSKGAIGWQQKFRIDAALKDSDTNPLSFHNRYINRGALPIAFLLAIIIQLLSFPRFLLRGIHIWIHEFGHATVSWMAGYQATPLPFGWTNRSLDRSPIVYICVLLLLLILFWSGWREKKRWAMVLASILAVIQLYMTWIMSTDTYEMLVSFGGVGGEFYLSTLLIVCFYFPLPEKFNWDFWRYLFLLMAAHAFTESFGMWHNIKTGAAEIPWGSMLGGQGDAGGDMNRLRDFNWSDSQIVNTYSQLGNICLFVLIGVYIFFLLKSLGDRRWQHDKS
jgi:hypothetical protein